ncbi:hypothetical protein ACFQ77_14200 [Streptomyces virginiae]|uniref:ATP-dependent DNA ligase n=1 Tax=Streptomyces virginiae TaxID=1961 RepID=UPI00369BC7F8
MACGPRRRCVKDLTARAATCPGEPGRPTGAAARCATRPSQSRSPRRAHTLPVTRPYVERRALLENLFCEHALSAPWTLCPQTTDLATAREWLESWTDVSGVEGILVKPLNGRYLPGYRGWTKIRRRDTTEAIVGAITGTLTRPGGLPEGDADAVHPQSGVELFAFVESYPLDGLPVGEDQGDRGRRRGFGHGQGRAYCSCRAARQVVQRGFPPAP